MPRPYTTEAFDREIAEEERAMLAKIQASGCKYPADEVHEAARKRVVARRAKAAKEAKENAK